MGLTRCERIFGGHLGRPGPWLKVPAPSRQFELAQVEELLVQLAQRLRRDLPLVEKIVRTFQWLIGRHRSQGHYYRPVGADDLRSPDGETGTFSQPRQGLPECRRGRAAAQA